MSGPREWTASGPNSCDHAKQIPVARVTAPEVARGTILQGEAVPGALDASPQRRPAGGRVVRKQIMEPPREHRYRTPAPVFEDQGAGLRYGHDRLEPQEAQLRIVDELVPTGPEAAAGSAHLESGDAPKPLHVSTITRIPGWKTGPAVN